MTSLDGRVAVVTGGAGGIGAGVTRALARAGATVLVNDIDAGRLDSIADEITSVIPVLGDIRDRETVTAMRDRALTAREGRVDVLVNNVGDYRPNGRFVKTTEDDWTALYATNF